MRDLLRREARSEPGELLRAQRDLELARESMRNAAYAIFWVRADGSVMDHNRTAARLLGGSADLTDTQLDDCFAESRSAWLQIWQSLVSRGSYAGDMTWRRTDGAAFPVRLVGNRVSYDGRFYGCLFVTDRTEAKLAEDRLADTNARFRAITENTSDLVFVLDRDGVTTYVSPAAARTLGDRERELLGRRSGLLVHEQDRSQVERVLAEARRQPGRTFRLENVRARRPDGSWLLLDGTFTDLPDEPGVDGTVVVYRDVTESRRVDRDLQESRRRLATLLGNLPGLAYRCRYDREMTLEFVSGGSLALTGYRPEQFFGERPVTARDIIHPDDVEQVRRVIRSAMDSGSVYEHEYRIVAADGTVKWVWEQGVGVTDGNGEIAAMEGFLTDVTGRVEAERTIRELNGDLERRVAARTRDLEEAQEQLIASEKMAALGGLVAGLAHEINTPLGVGLTAASHLHDRIRATRRVLDGGGLRRAELDTLLADGEDSAGMIVANLSRTADLVQSFKRVSVDQCSEERRMFDLGEYLAAIVASLRPQYRRRPLRIAVDCEPGVVVDSLPGAVAQIVSNLVQNSLLHAYGPEDQGTIRIAAAARGDDVEVVYADDGRGMDDSVRRRVFDPFFTTRRSEGGSGLGMHIVYNLVTGPLGGSIACTSRPGEGTTFRMTFPRCPAPAETVGV
ncbi:MAG: PAS domain S-box protein [Desulfobacterales bacterium]|nr:PAS domain S-box protein [Desulfobacterales bacterium]